MISQKLEEIEIQKSFDFRLSDEKKLEFKIPRIHTVSNKNKEETKNVIIQMENTKAESIATALDSLDDSIKNEILDYIKIFLLAINTLGIYHNDANTDNIMVRTDEEGNYTVFLMDFSQCDFVSKSRGLSREMNFQQFLSGNELESSDYYFGGGSKKKMKRRKKNKKK